MKYSSATLGRVFVLRLEDGEIIHETIEKFARQMNIKSAALQILGGADKNSRLIAGPQKDRSPVIVPTEFILDKMHETTGVGTIFPDEKGEPVLHMHIACGRRNRAKVGCIRKGVKVWHVMEVILWELAGSTAKRAVDPQTGLELLQP